MDIEWMLAKYMPDLRRREPRNVGVILRVGDEILSRFQGEGTAVDGSIDGRSVKSLGGDTYKAWVDFWQRSASLGDLDAVSHARPNDNYFVEPGGERLIGTDSEGPQEMLSRLFEMLVGEDEAKQSLEYLSTRVIKRAGLDGRVQPKKISRVTEGGVPDLITFDYALQNGALHLMKRVPLTLHGDASWDAVHAAVYAFQTLKLKPEVAGKQDLIALVKTPEDGKGTADQLAKLVDSANLVVQVNDVDSAAQQLQQQVALYE